MRVGLPEILILLVGVVFWIVPLAAGIWALVTLQRIRAGQDAMQQQLANIEARMSGASRG